MQFCCRTPRGVRGLKLYDFIQICKKRESHPSRGAWIEIREDNNECQIHKSHPSRGAWIEMLLYATTQIKR